MFSYFEIIFFDKIIFFTKVYRATLFPSNMLCAIYFKNSLKSFLPINAVQNIHWLGHNPYYVQSFTCGTKSINYYSFRSNPDWPKIDLAPTICLIIWSYFSNLILDLTKSIVFRGTRSTKFLFPGALRVFRISKWLMDD